MRLLIVMLCAASIVHGATVQGTVNPVLPRNPYWYTITAIPSGEGLTNIILSATTPEFHHYIHRGVPDSYELGITIVRGNQIDEPVFSLVGSYSSTLSSNTVTDGGLNESVRVKCVSRGITRHTTLDFDDEDSYTTYEWNTNGLSYSMIQEMTALTNTYGYSLEDRMCYIPDGVGYSNYFKAGSSAWNSTYPEYAGYFTAGYQKRCWNPNRIVKDIDLTCMSVWGSQNNSQNRPACLVTPKHAIGASHWGPMVGATVVWMDNDGNSYSRTVTALYQWGDIRLMRLDSALPAAIKPAKVWPKNWTDYFEESTATGVLPFRKNWKPVYGSFFVDQMGVVHMTYFTYRPAQLPSPNLYGTDWGVDQDSGHQMFNLINGEAVLAGCFYFSSGGPTVGEYTTEINAQISAWGDSEVLTHPDLSEWE